MLVSYPLVTYVFLLQLLMIACLVLEKRCHCSTPADGGEYEKWNLSSLWDEDRAGFRILYLGC